MSDTTQKNVFLTEEADKWFERNSAHLVPDRDDVAIEALNRAKVKPERILEIGCANGYRLFTLKKLLDAQCFGIELSQKAVDAGQRKFPSLNLQVGSADSLPYEDNSFDLVIFGFCFYIIDPKLHLRCVAEADRVLQDGGMMAIFDFQSPIPYHNTYSHQPGIRTYKLEFSRFFLAHPGYSLVSRLLDNRKSELHNFDLREGVDLLVKNLANAFPPNPFLEQRTQT
jgi:ubiquinone/menaquinone biosynthesis C-methylase UbiE